MEPGVICETASATCQWTCIECSSPVLPANRFQKKTSGAEVLLYGVGLPRDSISTYTRS
jgi:hypothetical protein